MGEEELLSEKMWEKKVEECAEECVDVAIHLIGVLKRRWNDMPPTSRFDHESLFGELIRSSYPALLTEILHRTRPDDFAEKMDVVKDMVAEVTKAMNDFRLGGVDLPP